MQVSNHDDVRRRNLSAILRHVHRAGATSRSELTRITGLNRSTIAALVATLAELGLVVEREPDASRTVGRPSPIVAAGRRPVAFAVNPEIDAITVAIVGLDGDVRRTIRHVTDASPSAEEAVATATKLIGQLRAGLDADAIVVGAGVAVPGLVRTEDGVVRHAPHLQWVDEPLAELLAKATGCAVQAANDASLGAMAERFFGAGRGLNDLVYLNGGSSGIGGGIIVGGQLVGGHAGYAGEFGHVRVGGDGMPDTAGIPGTLESVVTRQRLLDALHQHDGLELHSPTPDEVEQALLASNSSAVQEEIGRQLDHLAVALAGAANMLNPQLVVLGGFLAAIHAADPERLLAAVGGLTLGPNFDGLQISSAKLGSSILMIGAAELAFEALLDDPAGWVAANS
ncbi:putative NBD/HSP70 family sugar kinase [Homoserinimonas aerilata]|uniref:Putative NBD/HSP70 family sugar kinase n=1 Tax=Homoserinimonas aerilata TaxID=1162970 RepID=A0A542YGL0_9MICO|nr:putative NBD/HSP70 family sugar kinase [Homoserinimonas aerilata]